ncbi:uncharacterized protein LOC117327903 isoform X2 [Pecten maximus]|uniref:uncharacterized protein LOC117327903 isoform X2 n=1 Tax=Pecten maximus TaxID=6579 RepID=UPI0014591A19|nr:uncharacterized protein LOC117327903 isoform X2 [Pecten maximus]
MAGSRLPPEKLKHAMSLSRFMLRSQVIKLYRDMMRIVYNVKDLDQRKALIDFIRHDFKCNKHVEDEIQPTRGPTQLLKIGMDV